MQLLIAFIECCKLHIFFHVFFYAYFFFSAPSCIGPCQPAQPPSNNVFLSISSIHMISGHEIAALHVNRCAASSVVALRVTDFWH